MRMLCHPAGDKLHLVMEYAPSGSLLDYVRSRKRLGEPESCFFLQQIVAGLRYCHDNEVRRGEEGGSTACICMRRLNSLQVIGHAVGCAVASCLLRVVADPPATI
jgi:serine/threonine protein kinase